jgi:hypothetical protein
MTVANVWRNMQQDPRISILSGFGNIGRVHYLFPQGGGPRGSFRTFTDLKPNLRSRDTIILAGVLREQAVCPDDVYEVSIIGAAGIPRQATDGGVPTGGGATWMAPASGATAATPLLEIVRQGWSIHNVCFNPHTSSAAIRLTTAGGLDEAGQFKLSGCTFMGGGTGQIGLEDNGGSGFCVVEDNYFYGLAGTAILGISTANAVPLGWTVRRNRFVNNTNAVAVSASYWLICDNYIKQAADNANNKMNLVAVAAQGSNNQVINNIFPDAAANVTIAKGYKPGTTDTWRNYVSDTAAYIITVPA